MKCLNCDIDIPESSRRPSKYCSDRCRMAYKRNKRTPEIINEQDLRKSVLIEGETPNARYSREYREFQKKFVKDSCEEFSEDEETGKCKRCRKPYLRHHEARYRVYHFEV